MHFNHLSFEERQVIEEALHDNWSLYKIAKKLGRHRSTISREIKNKGTCIKTKEGVEQFIYEASLAHAQKQSKKR